SQNKSCRSKRTVQKGRFLDNCIQRRRKRIQDQRHPEGWPESKLKTAFGNMMPGKYGERTKERSNIQTLTLRESGKLRYKGHTVNALALEGDEGRGKLR